MRKLSAIVVFVLFFVIGPNVISAQDCPNSLPTNLSAGLSSSVNPGYSLDLRTAPENGDVIATLPEGSRFQIIGQAVCGAQNGLRWWQVEWNGQTGFIPESDLNNVWIEQPPAMFVMPGADVEEPTATPVPPTPTPATGIVFNDLLYEQSTDGLRFTADMTVTGYEGRTLKIFLWFIDTATNDYLQNPNASYDYAGTSGVINIEQAIQLCCATAVYNSGDIQLFIPYDQFPEGNYSFYPQLSIYDENLNLIDQRAYPDIIIPYTPPATGRVTFDHIDYQFADNGIWFLVDMRVIDRADQDLTVNLWFVDNATGELVTNPLASRSHRGSADGLLTSVDIQPESANQQYSGTDVALYMPYYEFPRGAYSYAPMVAVYDSARQQIARRYFQDVTIDSADHPFPSSGILIRNADTAFDEAGVHFLIDFDAQGHAGQTLNISVFASDYSDQYIHSALPLDDYYVSADGLIASAELVTPTDALQSFSGENRVDLYLPYNVFPVGTYSYFPVIGISIDETGENLSSRFFDGKQIDVLGDQPPAGYIVNFAINNLHVTHAASDHGMANSGRYWDNLLLTYGLDEVDSGGQTISGVPHYWAHTAGSGGDYAEDFETIYFDVLASSHINLRMDLVDVANLDAVKDQIDNLRDAGKLARKGIRFLPRLFRMAASAAGSYVNGWLWIYEIQEFLREDRPIGSETFTISPDHLYTLYQQTGMIDNRDRWITEEVTVGRWPEGGFQYDFTLGYWLYGYPAQQAASD